MLEDWIDFSNWSGVPTAEQVTCVREQGVTGVIIGLQDNPVAPFCADRQAGMFAGFKKEFYVDLPGRPLSLPAIGSIVWIDIEKGCFQRANDVRAERNRLRSLGLQPGIYTNEGGMAALSFTTEFSDLPLWYANPDLIAFSPFCGWTEMLMWQRTSTVQLCGFGVDMNRRLVADPVPPSSRPSAEDVALACVSAAHFVRNGFGLGALIPQDKDALRWLAAQL